MSFYNYESPTHPGSGVEAEPMATSNPNSPSSQQYLPEFLIGTDPAGSTSRHLNITPPGWRSSLSVGAASSPLKASLLATPPKDGSSKQQSSDMGVSGKPGGPPVAGLEDEDSFAFSPLNIGPRQNLEPSYMSTPISAKKGPANNVQQSPYNIQQKLAATTFMSPAQLDPFYTQGDSLSCETELDETWVTVFGFPPSAASFVLQQFSQYGTILNHQMDPKGNWMHVQFQNKLQAKKALSKNGKVFGGNIMVGVQPCIDTKVMKFNCNENLSSTLDRSIHSQAGTPKTGIRPLTQAYMAASRDHQVVVNGRTPTKTPDLLNKAMDFLFSW